MTPSFTYLMLPTLITVSCFIIPSKSSRLSWLKSFWSKALRSSAARCLINHLLLIRDSKWHQTTWPCAVSESRVLNQHWCIAFLFFTTHLRVTGSKQLKSTAASPSFYNFTVCWQWRCHAGQQGVQWVWKPFLCWQRSPPPSAEVPLLMRHWIPRHRQIKRCVVWMGISERVSYPIPPLLVYLFWSNEGNKLYCCCWCCWLLWLLSSVCKESVSALRTHRRRETFSITSTAVVEKKKSQILSLFVDEHYVFNSLCFC